MLSGQPNDLLMTESFHGTIIAWARQAGIFRAKNSLQSVNLYDTVDLESKWRTWAQAEETIRVILALHIHDAEFAAVFHHEPLLRHDSSRLRTCCSSQLFTAPTAVQWHANALSINSIASPNEHQTTPLVNLPNGLATPYTLHSYALLAGQYAAICEGRCAGISIDAADSFRRHLMSWYETNLAGQRGSSTDSFCLMVLWHEAFMALYADFDLLERTIGRDGPVVSAEDAERVRCWVGEADGRNCAVHAMLIYRRLGAQLISAESAIHSPKALFHAGVVVYCHVKFCPAVAGYGDVDIPELRSSGVPVAIIQQLDSSTLYGIADLLRRQGHWEISRRFASILDILIGDLTDATMERP